MTLSRLAQVGAVIGEAIEEETRERLRTAAAGAFIAAGVDMDFDEYCRGFYGMVLKPEIPKMTREEEIARAYANAQAFDDAVAKGRT